MDDRLEKVTRAMANAVIRDDEGEFPRLFDLLDFSGENKAWTVTYGLAQVAIDALADDLRLAGVKEGLEMAANYVDGQGGLIPGATAFVPLITGDNQPCMSGDARDRMHAHKRRQFDDATRSLSSAIRAIPVRADH